MRRWWLTSVLSLVLIPWLTPTVALQHDPISGTWTGEVVTDSNTRFAVTLSLKFDGKRSVTGAVSGLPAQADVKDGTFESKTGALKLPLGPVGDKRVLVTLEGIAVKDSAKGRAIDSSGEGTFQIARTR